jgi:hypothetical protein
MKIPLDVDYNYSSEQIMREVRLWSIHSSNMSVATADSKRVSYKSMRSDALKAHLQAS